MNNVEKLTLEMLKSAIDSYFESVSSEDLLTQFQELGYEFEPIEQPVEINQSLNYSTMKKQNTLLIIGQAYAEICSHHMQSENVIVDTKQDEDIKGTFEYINPLVRSGINLNSVLVVK